MTRTIRFRLTVSYSLWVFLIGALLLAAVYFAVQANLAPLEGAKTDTLQILQSEDGATAFVTKQNALDDFEHKVQVQAVTLLGEYSAFALSGLFLVSLAVGWWQSGRVLRPLREITSRAREIGATDLSRRINLGGPADELRGLADTLDEMLARLDEAFTDQRRLLGDASHELRNPLAIIQANVDAVLAHPLATPTDRAEAGAVVHRAVTRMTGLVDDLLATGRRDSGAFTDTEDDLSRIAAEAAEDHVRLAEERGLTLDRRLTEGLTVIGDHDALKRAAANLLANAQRFAPDGSAVELATGRWAGWCWLAVRDTGPGISEADQRHVFDRFWRAGGKPDSGHSGLGLAIVRQIVEGHGGRVAVHSTPGEDCTFVLWLPEHGKSYRAPAPTHNPVAAHTTGRR
ncbi:signal transduction histidine kinase [Crossiella equi]|uniref:histidine kinase n=1 Tax=Crossiella equi TaxID=130796 RepID=A0ABS5AD62_9PSEU|nr:HAMP domain-containing sensor histidine kinase [Crossiella equi]MBP2474510.1 signal transduction histidine kinase [Crossiella equi]